MRNLFCDLIGKFTTIEDESIYINYWSRPTAGGEVKNIGIANVTFLDRPVKEKLKPWEKNENLIPYKTILKMLGRA